MEKKVKIKIYTDGACKGNPGRGGYGSILTYTDANGIYHEKELTAGYINTTNNRMELMAAITALEALKYPSEVLLYSDSKYLVDAFNQNWITGWISKGWKRVKNVDLWKRLLSAQNSHDVKYIWIKGHAGHEYNERCDKLAVLSAMSDNLLVDEAYND